MLTIPRFYSLGQGHVDVKANTEDAVKNNILSLEINRRLYKNVPYTVRNK